MPWDNTSICGFESSIHTISNKFLTKNMHVFEAILTNVKICFLLTKDYYIIRADTHVHVCTYLQSYILLYNPVVYMGILSKVTKNIINVCVKRSQQFLKISTKSY